MRLTLFSILLSVLTGQSAFAAHEFASTYPEEVLKIFESRCGNCHSDAGIASDTFGSILNPENLIQEKMIVPGHPEKSKLFKSIARGSMPLGEAPLSEKELEIIKNWISAMPEALIERKASDLMTEDKVLSAILDDLKKTPNDAAGYRYLSLANLYNQGFSEQKLEEYRVALAKSLNSLSFNKEIIMPTYIDSARTVARIQLKDFGWTNAQWLEVETEHPFKINSKDNRLPLNEIKNRQKSDQPIVRADWFIANATQGSLYYSLLDLPRTASGLRSKLGVSNGQVGIRSGFRQSGVSVNNRIIQRQESQFGAYYDSLDFENSKDDRNIFKQPLDAKADGGEVIFELPNGLHGYYINDRQGTRLNKAPVAIVSDPHQRDRAVSAGSSCMDCHAVGLIDKTDEIGPFVAHRHSLFSRADLKRIESRYVPPKEFSDKIATDTQRYQKALKSISPILIERPTLVRDIRKEFERDLDLERAACEIEVSSRDLLSMVETTQSLSDLGLHPNLSCSIPREVMNQHYDRLKILALDCDSSSGLPRVPEKEKISAKIDLAVEKIRTQTTIAGIVNTISAALEDAPDAEQIIRLIQATSNPSRALMRDIGTLLANKLNDLKFSMTASEVIQIYSQFDEAELSMDTNILFREAGLKRIPRINEFLSLVSTRLIPNDEYKRRLAILTVENIEALERAGGQVEHFRTLEPEQMTIPGAIAIMKAGLRAAKTPDDFFRATSSSFRIVNRDYLREISTLQAKSVGRLFELGGSISDLSQIKRADGQTVENVIEMMSAGISFAKTREDLERLFALDVSQPLEFYIRKVDDLILSKAADIHKKRLDSSEIEAFSSHAIANRATRDLFLVKMKELDQGE